MTGWSISFKVTPLDEWVGDRVMPLAGEELSTHTPGLSWHGHPRFWTPKVVSFAFHFAGATQLSYPLDGIGQSGPKGRNRTFQ